MNRTVLSNILLALDDVEIMKSGVMALLIVFVIVALAVVIVALCLFFHSTKKQRKIIIENSDFNVRVYSYDYIRKRFYCFDRMNLRNVKTFDEESFLAQFRKSDTYRIKDWLSQIINGKKTSESLQVDIKINRGKKVITSFLRFSSINKEKQIIHFESQLLPYMYMKKAKGLNVNSYKNQKVPSKYIMKTEEEAKRFLNSKSDDVLGAIFYFELYTDKVELTEEDHATIEKCRNEVERILNYYLSKNRKMLRLGSDIFLIIDGYCLSRLMAMNLATTIHTAVQQYLNFNTPGIDLSMAVGISIRSLYQGNYVLGKEQAKKMAEAVVSGKTNEERVLLYDENFFTSYEQAKIQKEEVRSLIQNATFRIYYTPTVDLNAGKQSFYLMSVKPYGTGIKDFTDILNISTDIRGGTDQLLGKLYQKVIAQVKQNKENTKLALEIPYALSGKFVKVLEETKIDSLSWILCFRESDLLTESDDINAVLKRLRDYRKIGYEVGVVIDNLSSGLRSRILRQVSCFFVPNVFTTQMTDSNQSHNDLRVIHTNYSQYHVPIIYYGLEHIDDIEIGLIHGGRLFQCDEVALPSSRLEQINEDTIEFLMDDARKLVPNARSNDNAADNSNQSSEKEKENTENE